MKNPDPKTHSRVMIVDQLGEIHHYSFLGYPDVQRLIDENSDYHGIYVIQPGSSNFEMLMDNNEYRNPTVEEVENNARSIFADDPSELILLGHAQFPVREQKYYYNDGTENIVNVEYHPDPRCDQILRQMRGYNVVRGENAYLSIVCSKLEIELELPKIMVEVWMDYCMMISLTPVLYVSAVLGPDDHAILIIMNESFKVINSSIFKSHKTLRSYCRVMELDFKPKVFLDGSFYVWTSKVMGY